MIMFNLTELGLWRNILRSSFGANELANSIPHLNPIEYLWDYLGKQVAASSTTLRPLNEFEQALLYEWHLLIILVSGNLIKSWENRCHQCITGKEGHIPYENSLLYF
ncbi:hypothetical protein AVEN_265169-1 [Araneus ventricosus]|uniref:Tc1-like transposase DDE domain-containing protein n=1 Tax=Araneus ventricosus TaxID=182803 RepID=A0A4Y2CR16_ARAVE|nr:hypothetical protein AVEN_265169-1 [Araneus ventricosus]